MTATYHDNDVPTTLEEARRLREHDVEGLHFGHLGLPSNVRMDVGGDEVVVLGIFMRDAGWLSLCRDAGPTLSVEHGDGRTERRTLSGGESVRLAEMLAARARASFALRDRLLSEIEAAQDMDQLERVPVPASDAAWAEAAAS